MLGFFILEIFAELELTCLFPPDLFVHSFLLLSDILKDKDIFFLYSSTKEIQVLTIFSYFSNLVSQCARVKVENLRK